MESFKFNNLCQQIDQTIESFTTELKQQASKCKFKCTACNVSYEDRNLDSNLDLDKIQDYCKSVELSKLHAKLLNPEYDVHYSQSADLCTTEN